MPTYDAVLDITPAFGWQGGPTFNTRITSMRNKSEHRNPRWDSARHHYVLPFKNIPDAEYLQHLKSVFMVVHGQWGSFFAKDHSDYKVTGGSLGTAPSSGTAPVQLTKTDVFGVGSYVRTITAPKAGTVTVYVGGVAKPGTIDTATGLFTPSSAWSGGALTADFEFYVPVRFGSDVLAMSIDDRLGPDGDYAVNGSIELIEVSGE